VGKKVRKVHESRFFLFKFYWGDHKEMKFVDGFWLRPFATGMSCIDTIDAECPRGLSLEECVRVSEQSPLSNAGYYVSFDHLPMESYCVPLNTVFYQNSNLLDSLIAPNNKTRLSEDNGVHVTVFYNEHRFPENSQLDQTPFLYFSNTCYLCQDRGDNGTLYLHADFRFYPVRETAMTVTLGQVQSPVFSFDTRVNTESNIVLFKNIDFSLLFPSRKTETFSWVPFSSNDRHYEFVDHAYDFINEHDPFYLYYPPLEKYVTVNKDYEMTVNSSKPLYPFFFELDPSSRDNQYSRANWKDVPRLFPEVWKNLNEEIVPGYLCENFADCTARTTQPLPSSTRDKKIMWVLVGVVASLWFIVLLVGIVVLSHTPSPKTSTLRK
jgi:hypothetical protein